MSKIDENFIYKTAYEVIVDALEWMMDYEDSKRYPSFVSGVSDMVEALKRKNNKMVDTEENMENE